MAEQNRNYGQIKEITLHFEKGTVEPFTAKDVRNIRKDEKTTVRNRELKSMVEFYKKGSGPEIRYSGDLIRRAAHAATIHLKQAKRPSHIHKQGNSE